ncbi:MAG: protein-disulfide reductase DsbD domain-containing protein, partial [Hyphomicrobiaceae bacterium]
MIVRIFMACCALFAGAGTALAGPMMTDWAVGHKSKARLLVGALPAPDGRLRIYAGVEVAMESGWKTYWRHPGDAGGVPPYFDWSKSQNIKATKQLFPTPTRFRDVDGMSIGYKSHVVLPVEIELKSKDQRVGLAVDFQYGVCREICIPARARLALAVEPADLRSMPPQLAVALATVPRRQSEATDRSP